MRLSQARSRRVAIFQYPRRDFRQNSIVCRGRRSLAMRLPSHSIFGPNPIAASCPTAVLQSIVAPRWIAYPNRYADPRLIAVRHPIVVRHRSSPHLHWSGQPE
jgi:hypothetical protein